MTYSDAGLSYTYTQIGDSDRMMQKCSIHGKDYAGSKTINQNVHGIKKKEERDTTYANLGPRVWRRLVDDNFDNFAEFAKIVVFLQHFDVTKSLRKTDGEHQVFLYYSEITIISPLLRNKPDIVILCVHWCHSETQWMQ